MYLLRCNQNVALSVLNIKNTSHLDAILSMLHTVGLASTKKQIQYHTARLLKIDIS